MRAEALFILVVMAWCDGAIVKFRKKESSDLQKTRVIQESRNETGRGLLLRGLFSFSKVLNFFPVGGERECLPEGYHVARAGICLNAYDCRQRDGAAAGDCAHGLGVCCVFEVTCGGTVQNNLTYFMSPGFPELWTGDQDCSVTIEKTHAGIMQLKIDFVHFTIGQPNRTTGECDEDAMILGEGDSRFSLCGQNHGQHIYYTLSSSTKAREADDLASTTATRLTMRMRGGDLPRLWLLRLAQMPLAHSAPHECLQYYTADNGTIKTFNYASNGRHLASQDYKVCIRRNSARCSVQYAPCDARAFRIGPGASEPHLIDPIYETTPENIMMSPEEPEEDEMGSGDEPGMEAMEAPSEPSMMSRIWSYITSWMWQRSGRSMRWSPYAQHYSEDDNYRYFGYGNFGVGMTGHGRQRCQDRITIPCENEYFVTGQYYGVGVCDPHHCGGTFCPGQNPEGCHVETSVTPFTVSVHFGPPAPKRSPEENIGMCLKYSQQPCDS